MNEGNTHYSAVGGVLFNADGTTLLYYPPGKTNSHYDVPNGVVTIADNAFGNYYQQKLSSVTLSSTVEVIGASAFLGTKFTYLDMGTGVHVRQVGANSLGAFSTIYYGGGQRSFQQITGINEAGITESCNIVYSSTDTTGLSLDQTFFHVNSGSSVQLTATVEPSNATNKNVSWASSDESVATVNASGSVYGVAPGTAVITATTEDGGFTASANVIVTVGVIQVGLNKNDMSLLPGEQEQLIATVTPANASNKNVTWTSSNEAVATVSENGFVTAVAPGAARIYVRTVDGNLIASCLVTVPVSVTGVELDQSSVTIAVGSDLQLAAARMHKWLLIVARFLGNLEVAYQEKILRMLQA